MKTFGGAGSFAVFLRDIAVRAEIEQRRALTKAAEIVRDEAKTEIGTYQDAAGPFAAWAPLAESTLMDKAHGGFAPPDNPLLRTGELRDSIEMTVAENRADIGSNDPVAVFHEFGTDKMPPRSFLGHSLFAKKDEIAREIGEHMAAVIAGERIE